VLIFSYRSTQGDHFSDIQRLKCYVWKIYFPDAKIKCSELAKGLCKKRRDIDVIETQC
jgi:hypothetical protein